MRKSWVKHEKVLSKSLESHEKVLSQSWESYEKVIRNTWQSLKKVIRKTGISKEKVIKKLLESHETVTRHSTQKEQKEPNIFSFFSSPQLKPFFFFFLTFKCKQRLGNNDYATFHGWSQNQRPKQIRQQQKNTKILCHEYNPISEIT